jgi:membrane-bound serine protease (ClpP class)
VLTFAFRLLPKTRLGRAILLEAPTPGAVSAASDPGIAHLVHKTGITVSALRPAGYARIEGQRIDVVTRGEMLEEGCPVRVVDVSGNRVVVARDHGTQTPTES